MKYLIISILLVMNVHVFSQNVNEITNQKESISTITEASDPIGISNLRSSNTAVSSTITNGNCSVARNWVELLLESIRNDFARPTVHARNLFHSSVVMYDVWTAYQNVGVPYFLGNTLDNYTCPFDSIPPPTDTLAARNEAISFAMYRLLKHRFQNSPGALTVFPEYDLYMQDLGYDVNFTGIDYTTGNPAALGNYIAQEMINYGLQDGSNEQNDYESLFYSPVNSSLVIELTGNPNLTDFNRWQPLTLDFFVDQSGNVFPTNTPEFLGPEWGNTNTFSFKDNDQTAYERNGNTYNVFCDPGAPPYIDLENGMGDTEAYQWGFALVTSWSSHLDPNDPEIWDISPASIGNIQNYPTDQTGMEQFYDFDNGGDASTGHALNPHTGLPYASQMVKRADYARVLAEFWADGPDSETPPGHWFTLLNYVNDHPDFEKRYEGVGPILDDLEWDVKAYFSLSGALHDAAVAAWSCKGWYDYIRPVSAIRGMAELGQCTDPARLSYNIGGLPLITDKIDLVEMGDALAGTFNQNVGKMKVKAWKGPDYLNAVNTVAGVDWILAEEWWPYQRPTFVTPNFAGYVSGHSTFSRAAAEVMTALTGDPFFPGGMGEFEAPQDNFLVFEDGPSQALTLQWATYRDASDQCSLSRIWGGIHPPADDIPGRLMGIKIGQQAYGLAKNYIAGDICQKGIALDAGWNLISSNCVPANSNLASVFNAIGGNTIQVKDLNGVYIPALGINSIGDWDIGDSYLVKMTTPETLLINGGLKVEPSQTPIYLDAGWNELGYLLGGESDPTVSLSAISSKVIQLKDLNGVWVPALELNEIGNLKETKGYMIKMNGPDTLYYSSTDVILGSALNSSDINTEERSSTSFYSLDVVPNPNNTTLVVIDENQRLEEDDEILVLDSEMKIVGFGKMKQNKCGILLYGDDSDSSEKDGLEEGEQWKIQVVDGSTGQTKEVKFDLISGSLFYSKDGLNVVASRSSNLTGLSSGNHLDFKLYPNPSTSKVHLTFHQKKQGAVEIDLLDFSGRLLETMIAGEFSAGNNELIYDLSEMNEGIYWIRISGSNGHSAVKKLVLVK